MTVVDRFPVRACSYFRTGDIGQREADGTVRLIDRVKNVFKLAQGEFVAAEVRVAVFFSSI